MSEDRLVLEAESRGGARYVTLVRADGRRTPTDVLAHPEAVAAFNASPPGASPPRRYARTAARGVLHRMLGCGRVWSRGAGCAGELFGILTERLRVDYCLL